MRRFHCICVFLAALLAASPAVGQAPAADDTHGYIIFLRGAAIGREDVTTRTSAEGMVISGRGRLAPPLDIVTQQAEVRYRPDGTPESLSIDAIVQGHEVAIRTSFKGTEAVSQTTEDGKSISETHKVSPKTIVVPNLFFGMYAALAARLVDVTPGTELPVYVAPQTELLARVRAIYNESVQTTARVFPVRRYELGITNPGGDLLIQLTADHAGRLIRLMVQAQSLDIVREDVASANSRISTYANASDESVTIPAVGFNIAGTITRPKTAAKARVPAVVLVSGSGANDRDSVIAGVPVIAQLAGALADAGYLVIRFDKRGYGQSGGRAEAATLTDFSDDVRTVLKYLTDRKEVDSRRIAVVGHGEGAWVAMLTAGRDKKVAAVALLAAASTTGADLVLEQQRRLLDQLKVPEPERQEKIALQKQIHDAVLTGQGWEGVPPAARRQADTPWFQSLLRFEPAKALKDVRQPILVVQGELDRQVPVAHAERLADLARKVSDSKSVDVVTLRGVNHLLVPATSGEMAEYGLLKDLHVSKDVTATLTGWLSRALVAR